MPKTKTDAPPVGQLLGQDTLRPRDIDLQAYRDLLAAMMSGDWLRESYLDVPEQLERDDYWKNPEYRPHSSGVPYIFGGGAAHPMSSGQSTARDITAGTGIAQGGMDLLGALMGAWRKRKGGTV